MYGGITRVDGTEGIARNNDPRDDVTETKMIRVECLLEGIMKRMIITMKTGKMRAEEEGGGEPRIKKAAAE